MKYNIFAINLIHLKIIPVSIIQTTMEPLTSQKKNTDKRLHKQVTSQ